MSNFEELSFKLALETGSFSQQMQKINREVKNLDRDFKSAGKGIDGFDKSFQGVDKAISTTSSKIQLFSQKLQVQEKEYNRLNSVVDKQKQKLSELEQTFGKNSEQYSKQAQLVGKNSEKLNKLTSDINSTKGSLSQLGASLNKSLADFEKLTTGGKSLEQTLSSIDRQANLTESEFNKLGSELSKNGQFFNKLGIEISQMTSKIDSGVAKMNAYEREINKLSTNLNQNKEVHSRLASEIKKTETELTQAESKYGKNSKEVLQLKASLLQLKDSFRNCENDIEKQSSSLQEYQTELNQTETEVNQLAQSLSTLRTDRIGERLTESGQKLKQVGQGFNQYVTRPVALADAAAAKLFYDYDKGLAKVGSLVGKSGQEMQSYGEQVKKVSTDNGVNLNNLTEAWYNAVSAGVKLKDSVGFLDTATKLSVGGFTSSENAVNLLSTALNIYGDKAGSVTDISDKLLQVQNKGVTTVEQLSSSMGQSLSIAGSYGVSFDNVAAAFAQVTTQGRSTSEASTQITRVLEELGSASSKVGGIIKEKTGKSFTELMKSGTSLQDVLKIVAANATESGVSVDQLFSSSEAGQGALALLNDETGSFNDKLKDIQNSSGLTQKAFEGMQQSAGAKLLKAINELKNSLIDMGAALSPFIEVVADGIAKFADFFNSLDSGSKTAIVAIAGIAATIGPVLSSIGTLMTVGGSLSGLMGTLGVSAGAVATVLGGGFVLALAALVEKIGNSNGAIKTLQDKFGAAGTAIGGILEVLAGGVELTFGTLMIMLEGVGKGMLAVVKGDFSSIPNIVKETNAKLSIHSSEVINNLTMTTTRAMSILKNSTKEQMEGVKQSFDLATKELPNITDKNIGEVANKFTDQFKKLDSSSITVLRGTSESMNQLMAGITKNMSDDAMAKRFRQNIQDMIASGELVKGELPPDIEEAMNLVSQSVANSGDSIKKSGTDIFNKLKDGAKLGVEGMANNVSSMLNGMNQETFNSLTQFGSTWKQVFDGVKTDGSMSTAEIKDKVIQNINALKLDSGTLMEQLRNESSQHWEKMKGDAESSSGAIAKSIDEIPKEIQTIFKNNGVESEKDVLAFYNSLQQLPPEVQTLIKADNFSALQGCSTVEQVLANIPIEKRVELLTNVQQQGNMSAEQLQMILDSLPDEEKVRIETQLSGQEQVKQTKEDIENLPKDSTSKVNVDVGNSSQNVENIKNKITEIDGKTSSSSVNVDTSKAESNVQSITSAMGNYDSKNNGKTKTTKFNTETATASKNVTGLKSNIQDYDNKNTDKTKKTTFNTETAQASKNVTGLRNNISSFVASYCKTFTTTFNVVTKYSTQGSPTPASGGAKPSGGGRRPIKAYPSIAPMKSSADESMRVKSVRPMGIKAMAQAIASPMLRRELNPIQPIRSMSHVNPLNPSSVIQGVDYNVNLLIDLENQLKLVNNQLDILDKNSEKTFGKDKIDYLNKQNQLLREQQRVQSDIQNNLRTQKSEMRRYLSNKGYYFNSDSTIQNYQNKLLDIERQLNNLKSVEGDKDEARIKDLERTKKVLEEYMDVTINKLPSAGKAWLELQNKIDSTTDSVNKLRKEQLKFIEEARYEEVIDGFVDLENELSKIDKLLVHSLGNDRVDLLNKQIDILKREENELNKQRNYLSNQQSKLRSELYNNGFRFDSDGDLNNYSKQLENLINSGKDIEDIQKIIDEYLTLQNDKIPKLESDLISLNNKIKDIKKDELESIKSVEDRITKVYKKQVDDRIDLINKESDAKTKALKQQKDAYNDARKEVDYQNDYDDQLKKIKELQTQYDNLSGDNSLGNRKKLNDLLKKIEEENKKLEEMVQSKLESNINDMYDDESKRIEEAADKSISTLEGIFSDEKIAKLVSQALGTGVFEDIDGNLTSLQATALHFANQSGELFGVLGSTIEEQLIGNLQQALSLFKELDNNSKSIMSRYNLDINKIDYSSARYTPASSSYIANTTNKKKSESNVSLNFHGNLINIEGNVDKNAVDDLKRLENSMVKKLAKEIMSKLNGR